MPLDLKRRHGSPFWYIRGTVRGQRVDESTGLVDREAAEALRAKREWEITQGAVFGRRAVTTFLTAVRSYLEEGGEARFVQPLLEHFKAMPLKDIDQDAIDSAAKRLYPGRKPSTVNRQVHSPMSAIMRHAAAKGWTELRMMKRPRQTKGRTRWLSVPEAEALLQAAAPHLKPLLTMMLYTGCRCSEALLLEWREVDLSRAHVVFLDTKNGKDRGVPLHPRVVAALANLPHKEGRVFRTHKGKPYEIEKGDDHGGQIKTGFQAAIRRAGIVRCRPHDLRHTWATWHYAANRNLKALMELGGWQSEAMVNRYAHMNVDHLAPSIMALPGGPL